MRDRERPGPSENQARRPQAFVKKKFENIDCFVLVHIFIELKSYWVIYKHNKNLGLSNELIKVELPP